MKVEVGQIFEVTSGTFHPEYKNKGLHEKKRSLHCHLKKGEKLEIRYPFAWNFRTEDNMYLNCPEDYLLKNCKLIGSVKDDVRFNNKANLEEILRLNLWSKK